MAHRTPFVVGNWKMNTDRASGLRLALDIADGLQKLAGVDVGVCPPYVYLEAITAACSGGFCSMRIGAQDVSPEQSGAFTGEVSCAMLKDLGIELVIVGHSERRHVLGESDEFIGRKAAAALAAGMTCILCIGETIDQRRAGQTDAVNRRQLTAAIGKADPAMLRRLVVAYEPVWAIGTGNTATPADAQAAHRAIRSALADLHGPEVASRTRIQYGGSVKADNARDLLACPDVDGALVGGASLDAAAFLSICAAASSALH